MVTETAHEMEEPCVLLLVTRLCARGEQTDVIKDKKIKFYYFHNR